MSRGKRNAFLGICAALSCIFLIIENLTQFATLALVQLSALLIILCFLEIEWGAAALLYSVTSVLSLFLTQYSKGTILYTVVFGLYALLKPVFDRLQNRALRLISKFVLFTAAAAGYLLIFISVFGTLPLLEQFHVLLIPIISVGWIILFLLYDFLLTSLIQYYFRRWRSRIGKFFG